MKPEEFEQVVKQWDDFIAAWEQTRYAAQVSYVPAIKDVDAPTKEELDAGTFVGWADPGGMRS